jgi:methylated-DNA-[protein]-cysteine S-methyltransferase
MSTSTQPDDDAVWRAVLETPFGPLGLRWSDRALAGVDLDPGPREGGDEQPPVWLVRQIHAYLRQPGFRFCVPLRPVGTEFQRRVWRLISAIPPGQTRSYSAIAETLCSSPRAVGGACRANPYPLVVPCHRVVAKRGLGGFAGERGGRLLLMKRRLLSHEGCVVSG